MKFFETIVIIAVYLNSFVYSLNEDPVKDFKSPVHRKCNHDKKSYDRNYLVGKYDRKLASAYYQEIQFQNMRIHFDYSFTLPYEEKIIKELVMPPVKKFFENTLSVRRFPGKIRFPKNVNDCQGIPIPELLQKDGVETDLIIIVTTYRGMKKYYYENILQTGESFEDFNGMRKKGVNISQHENTSPHLTQSLNDYLVKHFSKGKKSKFPSTTTTTTTNTTTPPWEINDGPQDIVGWSFMCLQDIYTSRPLAGIMQYVADINPTARAIEEAVWTTLHEIMHILAMDFDLYADFIDPEFNKLTYEKTIRIKSKLKGLDKIIEERKLYLNDYYGFLNFNSSYLNNSNNTANVTSKNQTSQRLEEKSNFTVTSSQNKTENRTQQLRKNKNKIKNSTNTLAPKNTTNNTNSKNNTSSNEKPSEETLEHQSEFTNESKEPKKLQLPLADKFYEIKVPKNLNITMLVLAVENFIDYTKLYIKTPRVVEVGKKHYGCSSLDGVELEHFGGLGSSYSHWSKRTLNTEFMIADSYGENFISNFTLALLEDSGWYKVDYSKSEILPWGRNKGCEFLDEKCIMKKKKKNTFFSMGSSDAAKSNDTSDSIPSTLTNIYDSSFKEEFCTKYDEERCSISHAFRAICGISRYEDSLPKEYQYFENPRVGGYVNFGDFCPYPIEWMNPQTIAPIGSCRNGILLRQEIGEKICDNCRCFHSSLIEEKFHKKNTELIKTNPAKVKYQNLEETRATCYEARCRSDKKGKTELVIIMEDTEIKCPRGGAILSVDGYKGFIECPKVEAVCTGPLDPKGDYTSTSAYNLFAHLSEQLLTVLYEFISNVFGAN